MIQRFSILSFLLCCTIALQAQSKAETNIRQIMAAQEKAWNAGQLEAFMDGYWKSDSLKFIGSRGLTYGWQATLDNYKKGYPSREAMGRLTFTIISVEVIGKKDAFVIGKWHLKRTKDDLSGHYTLFWKKIKGRWVIVADHSS
jgi:ketosteroid isomerase-like protein